MGQPEISPVQRVYSIGETGGHKAYHSMSDTSNRNMYNTCHNTLLPRELGITMSMAERLQDSRISTRLLSTHNFSQPQASTGESSPGKFSNEVDSPQQLMSYSWPHRDKGLDDRMWLTTQDTTPPHH